MGLALIDIPWFMFNSQSLHSDKSSISSNNITTPTKQFNYIYLYDDDCDNNIEIDTSMNSRESNEESDDDEYIYHDYRITDRSCADGGQVGQL